MLGESAMTPIDVQYIKFSELFEKLFLLQGEKEDRTIEETLNLGWKILGFLPKTELKRIKQVYIEKYYKPWNSLPQKSTE